MLTNQSQAPPVSDVYLVNVPHDCSTFGSDALKALLSYSAGSHTSEFTDQIDLAVELDKSIPSLRSSQFLQKKTDLIQQAIFALENASSSPSASLEQISRTGWAFPSKTGVHKKRRNTLHETIFWELSILFECDEFIAPSLKMHIDEEEVTFQPYFDVQTFPRFVSEDNQIPFHISLSQYWKLALYTIITAHSDLSGDNLHYNSNGFILLDNDCCLPPSSYPFWDEDHLTVPIQSALLDLAPATKSISEEDFALVQSFLNQWRNRKKDIESFLKKSFVPFSLNADSLRHFWKRFDLIVNAHLKKNETLFDFFKSAFPGYFTNIEELTNYLGNKTNGKIGPISALHLVGPYAHNNSIILEDDVLQWIQKNYVH